MALDALHAVVDRLADAPGIRHLRQTRFDRHFYANAGQNLFRGVYPTFAEAEAAVPANQNSGYDSEDAASLYLSWLDVFDYDYPALFWIQRSFADGMRTVFDLGGNIGIKYYAYAKLAQFPEDLVWTVGDLPAVVEKGRSFAREQGAPAQLHFADHALAIDQAELLFASGSLQYLPTPLPEILNALQHRPRRVIVNITPVHASTEFYTVNSFGAGFSAYRIVRRDSFLTAMGSCGYRLRDDWKNVGKGLELPFRKELRVPHYSGFCFDLA